MRREDIEKAAGDYSGSILGFRDSQSVMDKHKSFSDGAEWRINSVWHDASEEPTEKKIIVVINSEDVISQISFLVGADNWNDCVKEADIVKWCYKEDLLPENY